MADNIKESAVPVKAPQYVLGFDPAGNWCKTVPPAPTDELEQRVDTVEEGVRKAALPANSLSPGYKQVGTVLAPPLASRGTYGDIGSLIYRNGRAYTIDTVLPTSGDLVQLLKAACNDLGDVNVQIAGQYTNGWNGNGSYFGVGRVHLVGGLMVADVVDMENRSMWQYANNVWLKVGGAGDGAAEEALAAANEAKTTANAAQATANEAKTTAETVANRLADADTSGLATGPHITNPVTGADLKSNVRFSQGLALVYAPYLKPGSITAAVEALSNRNACVTLQLNGTYTNAWAPSPGLVTGMGWLTVYPYGMAMAGFYDTGRNTLGLYLYLGGDWTDLKSGGIPTALAASLDMDGAEAQTVPAASEEPSAGAAMSEAREASEASKAPEDGEAESVEAVPAVVSSDAAPAVEAEEAGKEATDAE